MRAAAEALPADYLLQSRGRRAHARAHPERWCARASARVLLHGMRGCPRRELNSRPGARASVRHGRFQQSRSIAPRDAVRPAFPRKRGPGYVSVIKGARGDTVPPETAITSSRRASPGSFSASCSCLFSSSCPCSTRGSLGIPANKIKMSKPLPNKPGPKPQWGGHGRAFCLPQAHTGVRVGVYRVLLRAGREFWGGGQEGRRGGAGARLGCEYLTMSFQANSWHEPEETWTLMV